MEEACAAGESTGLRAPASGRADRDVGDAYRALRAAVARGLAHRVGCAELADDLTQDVFVDLLLAARRRPPSDTRAWLARVAQRRAADTIGTAVRERAARARLEASERLSPGADRGDLDARLSLEACLARLPAQQCRIVQLRLVDGLSFAHCGLCLGIGEDAARMRFGRALAALRRELVRVGLEAG